MSATEHATGLPPQFEIRKLTPEHLQWAAAILSYTNIFFSPVWAVVYPDNKTKRLYDMMQASDYLVAHQIESGLSYGVFDTNYTFKRPESSPTGGKLYWDHTDIRATKHELLGQMDFPLVSIALSYDGINPLDKDKMKPLIQGLPLFATALVAIEGCDKRDPASWKAKSPGELLLRNGTSTRHDYEGLGVMKALAHFVMLDAAKKGFKAIQIETAHDAVNHVWMNPPGPFRAELVAELDTKTYEQSDGVKCKPFAPSQQVMTRVYVTLSPGARGED